MDDLQGKLSPAEFLAALKGREATLHAPTIAGDGTDPLAGLDFSDLDSPVATQEVPSQPAAPKDDVLEEDSSTPRTSARKPANCEAIRTTRLSGFSTAFQLFGQQQEVVVEEAFDPAPETLADAGTPATTFRSSFSNIFWRRERVPDERSADAFVCRFSWLIPF
jgi:hypothetical protein